MIAKDRHDEEDLMKLLLEVFRRCRNADPLFNVLSMEKSYINIDLLEGAGKTELEILFGYTKETNKKSGRSTYKVTIQFISRHRLNHFKSKIQYKYLSEQRLWLSEVSKTRLPMKRCG